MKSLIVEDDYITATIMQEIMLQYGVADTASDGLEGIRAFKREFESGAKYDVLLLDIMMPEMDGQEVLEEIRNYESEQGILGLDRVKVAMCTALDDSHNLIRAFKNQCDAFIIKPISKEKIKKVLEEMELI